TDGDARCAGSPDAASLLAWLDGREGEWYRIRLSHVGQDPRIALRQQADLSPGDAADLCATLDRFDSSSTQGPWTRAVLTIIADQPATVAGDLAAELGLERVWFKRHVRKLKELGLTESLPTGYQLSPRGQALRNHLASGNHVEGTAR
ncbi:MAG TPA: hypothetical protein VMM13_19805, partial [Euzebya sp.]|nr:hypothetical protein [Euzebya sp.]